MAEAEFGVSLEQHLANRAGLDTTAQSTWQKYVGGPTSQVAQMAVGPLQALGGAITSGGSPGDVIRAIGGSSREQPGEAAKFVNPYTTPSKAGIIAGGAVGSGLAPASLVGKGLHTAATTMGMTTGGFAGGMAEGGAQGAVTGAGEGIIGGLTSSAIGATADALRNMGVERVRALMEQKDANAVGQALETMPKLRGVFGNLPRDSRTIGEWYNGKQGKITAEGLMDLSKGVTRQTMPDGSERVWRKGYKRLDDNQQQAYDLVQATVDKLHQKKGVGIHFPDALNPGEYTTWENARKSLTELGVKAYGGLKGIPPEPMYKNMDSKELYQRTSRLIREQLNLLDQQTGGNSLQAYSDAQGTYEAGRYVLGKVLRPAFQTKTAGRIAFDSAKVQSTLADKQHEAENKLGSQEFRQLANAVRLETQGHPLRQGLGRVGEMDVYNPSGLMSKVAGVVPGPGGAYARVHMGAPQLVGNPLNLADASRQGISLGAGLTSASVADYIGSQIQGIPGLSR